MSDEKHVSLDIAKILGIVVTLGAIIFGAGKLVQKSENTDATLKAFVEEQAQHNRLQDDKTDKQGSAIESLGHKVDVLNEQIKRVRFTRARRRDVEE